MGDVGWEEAGGRVGWTTSMPIDSTAPPMLTPLTATKPCTHRANDAEVLLPVLADFVVSEQPLAQAHFDVCVVPRLKVPVHEKLQVIVGGLQKKDLADALVQPGHEPRPLEHLGEEGEEWSPTRQGQGAGGNTGTWGVCPSEVGVGRSRRRLPLPPCPSPTRPPALGAPCLQRDGQGGYRAEDSGLLGTGVKRHGEEWRQVSPQPTPPTWGLLVQLQNFDLVQKWDLVLGQRHRYRWWSLCTSCSSDSQ